MSGWQATRGALLAVGVITSILAVASRLPENSHSPEAIRWSEIAAQHLREKDMLSLFNALGAADHALRLDSTLPSASYQRAIVLDRLGLAALAVKAYRDYLKLDPRSSAADECVMRLRKLRAQVTGETRELWRPTLLRLRAAVLGHDQSTVATIVRRFPSQYRAYAEGELLGNWAYGIATKNYEYAADELTVARAIGRALAATYRDNLVFDAVSTIDDAIQAGNWKRIHLLTDGHLHYAKRRSWPSVWGLEDAESAVSAFERARSPIRWAATEWHMQIMGQVTPRLVVDCDAIRKQLHETPTSYLSVHAEKQMRLASCLWAIGDNHAAAGAFLRGIRQYSALEDYDHVDLAQLSLAALLDDSGEDVAAWQLRRAMLASRKGQWNFLAEEVLTQVASEAVQEGSWDVARSAATLAIDASPFTPPALLYVLRAIATWNQRDFAAAERDLQAARVSAKKFSLNDDALRHIEATRLALIRQANPVRSGEMLARSLAQALDAQLVGEKFAYLLESARALRKVGKHREAATQLRRIEKLLTEKPIGVAADRMNDAYYGLSPDLYTELVDLLDSRGATIDAFVVAERERARRLLSRIGFFNPVPLTLSGVQAVLPPRTVLLSFVVLQERLLIFVVDRSGMRVVRVPIARTELTRLVKTMTDRLQLNGNWRAPATALHRHLIDAAKLSTREYDAIVITPDSNVEGIPYATLLDTHGRSLIEQYSIVVAPSASVYARLEPLTSHRSSVLAVGDPSVRIERLSELPRLQSSGAEAEAIASLYQSRPLIGAKARTATVLKQIGGSDIIHIGAHTLINAENPLDSSIVLSDGLLRLRDIATRRVRRGSVAVLAGCRTASRVGGKSDVNSLALAFLAAGSRSAVGALWDVEDDSTRRFSIRLHQLLRTNVPIAAAVQQVQVEMLRSPNSDPRSWAAFQVYGGG